MPAPTIIRLATRGHTLKYTMQVVTYFENGRLMAAYQQYLYTPEGRTVMEMNMVFMNESAAITEWQKRVMAEPA